MTTQTNPGLPTTEEFSAAFPQAVLGLHEPTSKRGYGRLYFKLGGQSFVLRKHPGVEAVDCWLPRYGSAHKPLLFTDWKASVAASVAYARDKLVEEAEAAQAVIAALDEAMSAQT